jgi:hypothetical protein
MNDALFVEPYKLRVGGAITAAREEMSSMEGDGEVLVNKGIYR